MTRIEVWHIADDTVAPAVIETDAPISEVNAKIHRKRKKDKDKRGYVRVPGRVVLYRQVELIKIEETGGAQ